MQPKEKWLQPISFGAAIFSPLFDFTLMNIYDGNKVKFVFFFSL